MVKDPLTFASELLESRGALVEPASDRLHVLLPPELQSRLRWTEDTVLLTHASEPSRTQTAGRTVTTIGYGMDALDRLLDLARDGGSLCSLKVPVGYPNRRDLAALARRTYLFHTRVRVRFEEGLAAIVPYALVHFVLSVISEETYDEMLSVVVNAATLAPCKDLLAVLMSPESERRMGLQEDRSATAASNLQEVYDAAGREASRLAAERVQVFAQTMDRRRRRDRDRLHTYFEKLAVEARQRSRGSRGRRLTDEEGESRVDSFRRELAQKVADLELRYSLRATATPVAAAMIRAPILQASYHLQWKRDHRPVPVVWSPITGGFEPIACDGCGSGGFEFSIGEDLRRVCRGCG